MTNRPNRGRGQEPHGGYRPISDRLAVPPGGGAAGRHGGGGGNGGPRGPRRGRARPPRQPRQQSGIGFFPVLLMALFAIALVVGGAAAYLVLSPPTDLIRAQIVSQVKANTGRDLVIAGPTKFTFFPTLGVSMEDVSLSAPSEMGGAPTATIKRLNVAVQAMPLIKKQIVVDELVLTKPVFDLRVDAQGRKSWDISTGGATPARTPPAPAIRGTRTEGLPDEARAFADNATDARTNDQVRGTAPSQGGHGGPAINDLKLGDVRIEDGTLRYADARSGANETLSAINVKLVLASLASPLSAKGDVTWKREKISFDGRLDSFKRVLDQAPAQLDIKTSSRPVGFSYKGALALKDGLGLDGDVAVATNSVRQLAGWLGTALPQAQGFGPMNFSGRLKAIGDTYTLINANLGLDGSAATGSVKVVTGRARPYVNAALDLSELDLNKYIGSGGGSGSGRTGSPSSIDDLLKNPSTEGAKSQPARKSTAAATGDGGWSREKIDFSGLGQVDADVKLSVGRLLLKDIKIGQSRLSVKLDNANMKANINEMKLYEGRGFGLITIDARSKAAKIDANLKVEGVSALPLMKDAAKFDWIEGRGTLQLSVATRGQSQYQFVKGLGGNANFVFNDGAIVGFNIPGMIRGITTGQIGGLNRVPSEKTDFSELSASFQINKGIATNRDLRMLSPLMRLTGDGQVNMPRQNVDYTVRPKLVAELTGQGGVQGASGIEIPVRIHGPWAKLKYTPKLDDLLKDPNKAVDTVKKLGEKFGGEKTKKLLDGLLGGGNGDAGGQGSSNNNDAAKKLFEKLF